VHHFSNGSRKKIFFQKVEFFSDFVKKTNVKKNEFVTRFFQSDLRANSPSRECFTGLYIDVFFDEEFKNYLIFFDFVGQKRPET